MTKMMLTFFLLLSPSAVFCQKSKSISVIDYVKIREGKRAEALFFYESNWKRYRDVALGKGFIRSYHLLANTSPQVKEYDLILITEYADENQSRLGEERFNQIIKEVAPEGPKLLDDLKPADFRVNVSSVTTETIFSSHPEMQRP